MIYREAAEYDIRVIHKAQIARSDKSSEGKSSTITTTSSCRCSSASFLPLIPAKPSIQDGKNEISLSTCLTHAA